MLLILHNGCTSQKAGEVANRLKDANEQVAEFTEGSNFDQVSNS
jgi:hypothetical protein